MQERMEQNRLSILESARELIIQGGLKEASIQAIAERAGVSTGLVYRYFESKSQILISITEIYNTSKRNLTIWKKKIQISFSRTKMDMDYTIL